MKGFKSFANHTELVFDKDFNVILGPNGSGKSNVLDALCFVIGKSSAKSLRAEKTGNLVYNGGKKGKPSKDAEVSIFFDNKNKIFPLDDKEIKVSRIVNPDGTSIYKINNKKKTRANIIELLQYAKIDPDGYNIILQGDIVNLVNMKGIERRQIIEEIAGISVYEDKKQKTLSALEKVDIKLKEAEIVLSERSKSLTELKKEHDQAIKYKDVLEKQKSHEATLIQKSIVRLKEEGEKIEKDIIEKKSLIQKNITSIEEYQKVIKTRQQEVADITHEIETKGEKNQVEIHKLVEQLKIDIGTNTNKIESLNQEIEKAKQRKVQLEDSLKELNAKIVDFESKRSNHQVMFNNKKTDLEQIEKRISEFRQKYNLDGGNELDKEIESLDKQAEDLDKKIHVLRESQQEILREKDKAEFKIQTLDQNISKVKEIEKENQKEIQNLRARKEEFKKITLELSKVISNDSKLAAKLGSAREHSLKVNEDYARLTAKRASLNESVKGNEAVQKILDQKSKFSGVVGLVSELGDVDEQYALALEMAAGNKTKHIVVENDFVAAECIRYLKETRSGSATFIPINKVRAPADPADLSVILKARGVIGLATDLIRFDSKYLKVFKYVFGSTVVVENIDVARRIGIGKTKMVTLDGDLCEMSGIMKGGFINKNAKSLSFSQSQLSKELEKNEKRLAEVSLEISNLEHKKQNNEEEIVKLRSRKAELEGEIIKLEKSLHLDSDGLEASLQVKNEEEKKVKDLDKKLDDAVMQISQINRDLAQVKMKRQQIRTQINEIRNPKIIAELNTFEEKKVQLRELIAKLEGELKSHDLQLNSMLLPEKDKTSKLVKQSDSECEAFTLQVKELEKQNKEKSDILKVKEKEEKEFYEKFKEMFNKRSKVTDEIQKLEVKIISTEEYIRRIEEKITAITVDKTRLDTELKAYEEEFKDYTGVKLVENKSIETIKQAIYNYKKSLEQMGFVNLKSLEIYEKVKSEYDKLLAKKDVLVKEKDEILFMMAEIEAKKKEMFLTCFDELNNNFKRIFQELSHKGEAFLELINSDNPFEDGLVIKVRLSGDKFLDIRSLSGGEKTMTALAFIFSVQEYSPASFYVLDEVDAALDKRNSDLLGELIRKYSSRAQYVVISHNDELISKSDNLFGVSMNEFGISKVVSLKV
ncbi:chromosome segregation protein SMC [Candidatus Woesearchaeota archaeon]|nr:chromosome segregation protein SMC [Candidatus Woesearchaeota archaeon]